MFLLESCCCKKVWEKCRNFFLHFRLILHLFSKVFTTHTGLRDMGGGKGELLPWCAKQRKYYFSLFKFLKKKTDKRVLVGHKIKVFDLSFLHINLVNLTYGMSLYLQFVRFVDTLLVFRKEFPKKILLQAKFFDGWSHEWNICST